MLQLTYSSQKGQESLNNQELLQLPQKSKKTKKVTMCPTRFIFVNGVSRKRVVISSALELKTK